MSSIHIRRKLPDKLGKFLARIRNQLYLAYYKAPFAISPINYIQKKYKHLMTLLQKSTCLSFTRYKLKFICYINETNLTLSRRKKMLVFINQATSFILTIKFTPYYEIEIILSQRQNSIYTSSPNCVVCKRNIPNR